MILPSAPRFGKATVPTAPASAPLVKLERTIPARAKKPNAKSYTSQLLAGGVPKIGAKIIEEAAELVEAAGEPGEAGQEHFIREAGDLFYHLLVMLCHKNCDLSDVEAELARRFGVSGLEEKASRNNSNGRGPAGIKDRSQAGEEDRQKESRQNRSPHRSKKARRKTRL